LPVPDFLLDYSKNVASRDELKRILRKDILDIHGIAAITGMSRSSINTLLVRRSAGFPDPIYETSGDHRHPVRLWYRKDVEEWQSKRRSLKGR